MLTVSTPNPAAPSTRPSLTIPKWPFVLADLTLISIALALWATSGGLVGLPAVFCLGSVALGAVLLATPFALEAFPPETWRILNGSQKTGNSLNEAEAEWRRQARAATEAVEHAARANAALENSARRIDIRFAPLVEIHKNLEAVAAEFREAVTNRATASDAEAQAVSREMDRLRRDQAEKFKTTESKIAAMEDMLGIIVAHLKTSAPKAAPVEVPAKAARVREHVPVRVEAPAPIPVSEPVSVAVAEPVLVAAGNVAVESHEPSYLGSVSAFTPAPVEAPATVESPFEVREPVVERKPEANSLMARAISRTQLSGETPAVAGIIMARARRPRKAKEAVPEAEVTPVAEVEAPAAVAPVAIAETETVEKPAESVADTVAVEAPIASVEVEEAPAVVETPTISEAPVVSDTPAVAEPVARKAPETLEGESGSAIRRAARAKALALRGEDEEEAKKNTPVVFSTLIGEPTVPAAEPTQGELLAREADTIRRKRASRSPVLASVVTAHVLIGIGNKPFVRGTGPGLSQDKGVPMEFVEIGQWRWAAPASAKEPITLRIFKNDEVPSEDGDIVLKPGQTLDIRPVFPA
ncbi:MAG TPA: hypothetical protein VK737_03650 [Opitutales bacterium]|jgi:hypothetical protein|nr:hypothetical protein [Opitutales bacterium]